MDDDLLREIDEITKDMPQLTKPNEASDAVNEGPSDSKNHKTRALKSSEDGIVPTADSKGSKKTTRRNKNPFLIFAREQRNNVKSTPKNHKSTILGNMWQDLDYSEKKKYMEIAKIESILNADATPGPSFGVSKPKKRKSKKILRKLLVQQPRGGTERTLSKKNEAKSSIENTVDAVASGSSSVVPVVPNVSNPSDSAPRHHVPQPCSSSSCTCLPTSSSCFTTPSSSQGPTHSVDFPESLNAFAQPSRACHSRESSYRGHGSLSSNFSQQLCLHSTSDNFADNQPYLGGLYRPCLSGMPGFYPPDPLSYFWIYQHSMPAYHHPFSAFYQSLCPCSNSYGAFPGSHSRSFFYGQSGSTFPSAAPASFGPPAQATLHRDEVASNLNRQCYNEREASDNENNLVIVDDEQEGNEERPINKESQRQ